MSNQPSMNRWDRGRADVDRLLGQARLTRVVPNRELAAHYISQAGTHFAGASALRDIDPAGAFTLASEPPGSSRSCHLFGEFSLHRLINQLVSERSRVFPEEPVKSRECHDSPLFIASMSFL